MSLLYNNKNITNVNVTLVYVINITSLNNNIKEKLLHKIIII